MTSGTLTWYEFFAGGGMARLGLGKRWRCVFANEWSAKKASTYKGRFGRCDELVVDDVAKIATSNLPGTADLAWASFPCQDLSLAGAGAGLAGARSGTFRPFWRLMTELTAENRTPRIIVLENVVGALTSHHGEDFAAIIESFAAIDYRVGAVVVDAVRFVPQSRPRLFIIGTSARVAVPRALTSPAPIEPWHPGSLRAARERLPRELDDYWTWWRLPMPSNHIRALSSIITDNPVGVDWHSSSETNHLLGLMSPLHLRKIEAARASGGRIVGTVYKRTRPNDSGERRQRAEVRFDNVAGCLRTPTGGSSRQTVIVVDGRSVRTRLLSPREAADLMGIPNDYPLPESYNDAYHLCGDGVVVPVVSWLSEHLLRPLVHANSTAPANKQIA